MARKLVLCEINESYLENVKKQMKEQNMPTPKDETQITIAHKPVTAIELSDLECGCKVCKQLLEQVRHR